MHVLTRTVDGFYKCHGGDDCDDGDGMVYHSLELCDGQYNDCTNLMFSPTGAPADETDDDGDTQVECAGWVGEPPLWMEIVMIQTQQSIQTLQNCATVGTTIVRCRLRRNLSPVDELDDDGDLQVECSGWVGNASLTDGDCDDSMVQSIQCT